jgi:hypothetical protein
VRCPQTKKSPTTISQPVRSDALASIFMKM